MICDRTSNFLVSVFALKGNAVKVPVPSQTRYPEIFLRNTVMARRIELIATSAFGLEAVVSRELHDLGYHEQYSEDGRVTFVGNELAICRCNLWLRSADRLLVKVGGFPAYDFGEYFDRVEELLWNEWLPVDAKFPVSGKSVRSQLHHEPTIQAVTKKAIAESLKKSYQRHWF